jgi:hypothetical protein
MKRASFKMLMVVLCLFVVSSLSAEEITVSGTVKELIRDTTDKYYIHFIVELNEQPNIKYLISVDQAFQIGLAKKVKVKDQFVIPSPIGDPIMYDYYNNDNIVKGKFKVKMRYEEIPYKGKTVYSVISIKRLK